MVTYRHSIVATAFGCISARDDVCMRAIKPFGHKICNSGGEIVETARSASTKVVFHTEPEPLDFELREFSKIVR